MKLSRLTTLWLALSMSGMAASVQAQHAGHGSPQEGARSYAGQQKREIKALSEQQISDLRAGKGMTLALPAELNGYPGPSHVLELADALELTPAQKGETQTLFERMQAEAASLGEEVISAERALDVLFREGKATTENVSSASRRAAQAQGRLREAHLRYHLTMMDFLSPGQLSIYKRLRGY